MCWKMQKRKKKTIPYVWRPFHSSCEMQSTCGDLCCSSWSGATIKSGRVPAKGNCNPDCGNKDSTFLARFLKHQRVYRVGIAWFINVLAAGSKIGHVRLMIAQSRWGPWAQHAPRLHRQCVPAERSVEGHHDQDNLENHKRMHLVCGLPVASEGLV